jgi:hypothetical protein
VGSKCWIASESLLFYYLPLEEVASSLASFVAAVILLFSLLISSVYTVDSTWVFKLVGHIGKCAAETIGISTCQNKGPLLRARVMHSHRSSPSRHYPAL